MGRTIVEAAAMSATALQGSALTNPNPWQGFIR
jgi:hypothetical protein